MAVAVDIVADDVMLLMIVVCVDDDCVMSLI